MPKYLISYRKTEEAGQKPEWASLHHRERAVAGGPRRASERVEKRMSVLGEKLWGNGEVVWIGAGRLDDVLYKRDEAAPEIVHHLRAGRGVGGRACRSAPTSGRSS